MGKNKLRLQIITPVKNILDEEVEFIKLRTTLGDMGILYNHEPVVVLLDYHAISYKRENVERRLTTMGGFAEITKEKVVILTDASEFEEDIDIERAERAKERAKKRLTEEGTDRKRAEIALKKAVARLSLKHTK